MKGKTIRIYKENFIFDIYFDDALKNTHVHDHGVTDLQIYDFFSSGMYLERKRTDGSFVAVGYASESALKVIYRKVKITKALKWYYIISAWNHVLTNDEMDELIRSGEDL